MFATAIIAGVMAAKKTHELIPFCHPLGLENCKITITVGGAAGNEAIIDCTCRVHHKTGVEMEALTGASIAALTIYDMCKALSHDIVISETRLLSKTGGKQDFEHARLIHSTASCWRAAKAVAWAGTRLCSSGTGKASWPTWSSCLAR